MPIYKVTTPQGLRMIKAVSSKDAIEHASADDYKADVLSALGVADMVIAGHKIEVTAKADAVKADDGQTDIEEHLGQAADAAARNET